MCHFAQTEEQLVRFAERSRVRDGRGGGHSLCVSGARQAFAEPHAGPRVRHHVWPTSGKSHTKRSFPLTTIIRSTSTADLLRALAIIPPLLFSGSVARATTESRILSVSAAPHPAAPVNLGTAGDFAILSKSGITDVASSDVTGNVGTSPITGAADHLTCAEVTGRIYSVDDAGPAPCNIKAPTRLTTAVGDMQTAYTDAAGRPARTTELGGGNLGGLTLAPGVYSWGTNVTIRTNVALEGGKNDVWIFQISKDLKVAGGHP